MALKENFISREQKNYKLKIGSVLASALTGFIAGFVVALIIFGVMWYLYIDAFRAACM